MHVRVGDVFLDCLPNINISNSTVLQTNHNILTDNKDSNMIGI
jgi:hypothetical protein